ncbi:PREDICTED: carbohydrate deacetylase isoform X1 [Condylura cristata]|uniref:carbohydrate deacetylase isoform X1 n=1 Tax=Condylura cristata TaxID=143302 RepID=UPI000643325E|nr:PREDICTED: carbohydrate deacetylase isoform X1 [Condylura cristata]
MARPRVRLVVTADDFGYCPRRDEGIVEAFLAGAVTSVSLLVNGAAAESAAELARRHQIPTGLHANLSEGRPVGPACRGASSLLSPEGFFLGKMGFREAVAAGCVALPQVRKCGCWRMLAITSKAPPRGYHESRSGRSWALGCLPVSNTGKLTRRHVDRALLPGWGRMLKAPKVLYFQVREELEAQLSRFRELLGRDPTHVDGHQHVHVLPGVCQVFAEALQTYGVRFTRLPLERGVAGCSWLETSARVFACAVERDARAAVGPFSRHGLRWTDAFLGLSTCGRHMSAHRVSGALARALEGIPEGHVLTAELMAHPGYPSVPPAGGCGEGPDAFSCSWERLHELRVLTAPTFWAHFAQQGVQLCALDDLHSKRPGDGVPGEATLETLEPSHL